MNLPIRYSKMAMEHILYMDISGHLMGNHLYMDEFPLPGLDFQKEVILTRFPSPPFSCFSNCSSKLRHIHEADQKETIKYSAGKRHPEPFPPLHPIVLP